MRTPEAQAECDAFVAAWRTAGHVPWGEPYGCLPYVKRGRTAYLWRKGQRCQWYSVTGRKVGPRQANVAPAIAWALMNGWRSKDDPLAWAADEWVRTQRQASR